MVRLLQQAVNEAPADALERLRQAGLRTPRTLTLAITGACNLRCHHCWVEAGGATSASHVPEQTLRRLIEEFLELGGEEVRLTGGEPLCHPRWIEILVFCRSAGMRHVSLQTNGILFTDSQIASVRALDFPRLTIQVSLDGATAPTHELVRGKGTFTAAMEGIRRLVRGGLARNVTLFCAEMRHNIEDIPELFNLADRMGIGAVTTGSLVMCGRAAAERAVAQPTPEQYLELLHRYDTDPRFRELSERIGNVAVLAWRASESCRTECCTFAENPYLTADGRMYPCLLCHVDDYAVPGVFGKRLANVLVEGIPFWSTLMKVSRGRADAIAECRTCSGRAFCAGGCMGRAWGSYGNLLAADDRCAVRKGIYRLKNS